MKSRLTYLVLVVSVPVVMGFGGGGDNLVLIRGEDATASGAFGEFRIKAHFRGPGWILATASSRQVDVMEDAGLDVEVIDHSPWSQHCYFIAAPEIDTPVSVPSSFRVLARLPEGVLVKGPGTRSRELHEHNLWVVRIEDREIPLTGKSPVRFPAFSPLPSMEQDLMSVQVSDSAITEYITRLVDYRTRLCCTDSNRVAAQWIEDKFREFGYSVVYQDTFPFPEPAYPCDEQTNVVAIKTGTISPNRYIVIGGHYDSITYSPEECSPDTLAPGADDNATGTVGVLEAARVLFDVDTDVTLVFVAFGSEEQGLYGATALAQQFYDEERDIKLMFNMDMIGNYIEDDWHLAVWATSSSLPFAGLVAEMAVMYTDLIPDTVNASLADASPFEQRGYHNVGLAEVNIPANPQWHSCTDDIEFLSIPYLTQVIETVSRSILFVSNVPGTPTGVTAANIGNGTAIEVSWDPNEESDVTGYTIHYGTLPGVYDSLRTVTSSPDTLRNLLEETTFYISLTASDNDGYESFLSEEVAITVSPVPSAPTGLSSTAYEDSVRLSWEPAEGDLDVAGYNVYRHPARESADTLLLDFVVHPETSFTDMSAEDHVLYGYYLTAIDTDVPANESEPSGECLSRLATHDGGILIVDNTADGGGGPLMPTDDQVDSYYEEMLSAYDVRALWDVADSAQADRRIMDYDAGLYSSIVWHDDVRTSPYMAPDTTTMRKYIEGGGKLWLTGWNLIKSVTGISTPRYTFGPGDFVSTYIGIDSAGTTGQTDRDFVGAHALEPVFPNVMIDPEKTYPLEGLFEMNILLPPFSGTLPIYSYLSSDSSQSEYHGLPVAVADGLESARFVFTAFPLYFIDRESAGAVAEAVMDLFSEPLFVEPEHGSTLPRTYALSQNFPNPFNPVTSIDYDIPADAGDGVRVQVRIYDMRGRHVKTLVDEQKDPGSYRITWNGRNERGGEMGSGVYFSVITAGDFSSTRKMLLLR